jgi:beta-lactam-binding protein with PASTA domain
MPYVVGLEIYEVILILQQVGIFVPASLGYFGTFPITIIWKRSSQLPGTVLAQLPQPGTFVPANGPVTLTVAEFPIGVAFP